MKIILTNNEFIYDKFPYLNPLLIENNRN